VPDAARTQSYGLGLFPMRQERIASKRMPVCTGIKHCMQSHRPTRLCRSYSHYNAVITFRITLPFIHSSVYLFTFVVRTNTRYKL